tara:strand:+ start:6736 stop:8505 length:1770 start_codon:yes stop_codon:yes gene_type:complete
MALRQVGNDIYDFDDTGGKRFVRKGRLDAKTSGENQLGGTDVAEVAGTPAQRGRSFPPNQNFKGQGGFKNAGSGGTGGSEVNEGFTSGGTGKATSDIDTFKAKQQLGGIGGDGEDDSAKDDYDIVNVDKFVDPEAAAEGSGESDDFGNVLRQGFNELDARNYNLATEEFTFQQEQFQIELELNEERNQLLLEQQKFDQEIVVIRTAMDQAQLDGDQARFQEAQGDLLHIEAEKRRVDTDIEANRLAEQSRQFEKQGTTDAANRAQDLEEDTRRFGLQREDVEAQKALNKERFEFEKEFQERMATDDELNTNAQREYNNRQANLNVLIAANNKSAALAADKTDNDIAEGNWLEAAKSRTYVQTADLAKDQLQRDLQTNDINFQRELLTQAGTRQTAELDYASKRSALDQKEFDEGINRFNRNMAEQQRQFNVQDQNADLALAETTAARKSSDAQISRQQDLDDQRFAAELSRDPGSFLQSANLQRGQAFGTPPEGLTNLMTGETGGEAGSGGVQLPPALQNLVTGGQNDALITPDTGLGTPSVQQFGQLGPDEQTALLGLMQSLGVSNEDFIRMIQQTAPSQQNRVLTAA